MNTDNKDKPESSHDKQKKLILSGLLSNPYQEVYYSLISQIAEGIVHEIRNLLTSIHGFLQVLMSKEEFGDYQDVLKVMKDDLERANEVITQFVAITKESSELDLMNLNSIIKELQPHLLVEAESVGCNVIFQLEDIPDNLLNEKEIRELILSLARNGIEAMSDGGNFMVRTMLDGDYVVLSVSDEGPGIETIILEKLGTPFLTNKDFGTGLGFAICYGIARRNNATIKVETCPKGTTVLFCLNALRNRDIPYGL